MIYFISGLFPYFRFGRDGVPLTLCTIQVAVALYFIALVALAFNSAIAAGEVIISTLMDVEFPNKIFPFKLPYKRTILSSMQLFHILYFRLTLIDISERRSTFTVMTGIAVHCELLRFLIRIRKVQQTLQ